MCDHLAFQLRIEFFSDHTNPMISKFMHKTFIKYLHTRYFHKTNPVYKWIRRWQCTHKLFVIQILTFGLMIGKQENFKSSSETLQPLIIVSNLKLHFINQTEFLFSKISIRQASHVAFHFISFRAIEIIIIVYNCGSSLWHIWINKFPMICA